MTDEELGPIARAVLADHKAGKTRPLRDIMAQRKSTSDELGPIAKAVQKEYREGRTQSLDEVVAELGIPMADDTIDLLYAAVDEADTVITALQQQMRDMQARAAALGDAQSSDGDD